MATILGDFFKDIGNGLGKVLDGDILEGVGDVLGGTLKGAGRTIGFAGKAIGATGKAVGDLMADIFEDGKATPDEIPDEDKGGYLLSSAVAMLAKMAKADGHVTKSETRFLSVWLESFGMDADILLKYKEFANQARNDDWTIYDYAKLHFAAADYNTDLSGKTYLYLFQMALADGEISGEEERILREIPRYLGLVENAFDYVCEHPEVLTGGGGNAETQQSLSLSECYAALGCSPEASDFEVKNCYKKQMAQYHPDAISGKDLAPGFIEFANQQSAKINEAYETIKAARGMR